MQRLNFFTGTLLGWIIAWLVDFLVRRPQRQEDYADLEDALRRAASESASLKAEVAAMADLRKRLEAANAEIEALRAQAAGAAGRAGGEGETPTRVPGTPREEAAAARSLAGEPAVAAVAAQARQELLAADDLTAVEGIGPKISELLSRNGIHTFAHLAGTDAASLRAILESGGPRFRLADPDTWPEQARLARDGDWEGLKTLQASLRAGR